MKMKTMNESRAVIMQLFYVFYVLLVFKTL
jgi:hypothetical protein